MSVNGTVNALGNAPTHIFGVSGGAQTALLNPGQSGQITSPADVTVEPGGNAAIVTSDGSTIGVGPSVCATLIQAGSEPALNPWDMFVEDTASGWTIRFSDLSVPNSHDSSIGAPNATDGLTIVAPDNSTQVVNAPPEEFIDVVGVWKDSGNGEMQITQIAVTLQDNTQWTWNIGVGWSQTVPPVL
jgi:hypothetical protein